MKKKLEADLISIAHRVLQLKNKSDINQLYLETQKLYEKLAVLRFVDEHFSEVKPTIGNHDVAAKIESIFDSESDSNQTESEIVANQVEESIPNEVVVEEKDEDNVEEVEEEPNPIPEEIPVEEEHERQEEEILVAEQEDSTNDEIEQKFTVATEEITEEQVEEAEDDKTDVEEEILESESAPFIPAFELSEENEVESKLEVPKKQEAVQISFEDLLGGNYNDTFFVKKQQIENIPTVVVIETPKEEEPIAEQKLNNFTTEIEEKSEPKTVSLNDKLAKGINIDLNDRLAFIKHLFGNSSEDYNRVLSQLITFNTFYETRDFVQEMVKPDYNNWEGKQEYEDRFMDIIEKKFL
ncbi:hypothetical protein [Flavobacterium weaverense]|uniref:Uncharacterized protein n=1 Tax=Flavobacterium weaverense TaxID=271156 RepID=A0A3L9ZWC7_9FLAO|nr:hypothetical protein [Flavobacterium weaverense]RMA77241.1 hypothetical protein BC961_1238 [Flavobacterium weaverense]